MKAVALSYAAAAHALDAVRLLSSPDAKIIAGGQSLGPMLNLRLARPASLVDVSRAADLRAVTQTADAILYGAAVTHAEIEDGIVPDATPGWMRDAARRIAYRAVRNRGTIGGSLAHADPAADWVNVLTALDASVVLARASGERSLKLTQFFTGGPFTTALAPDEIIAKVIVPRRDAAARWAYWKFCRKTGEFAKASAAVLIDPVRNETRVLLGAIERPPILLPDAQAIIAGHIAPAEAVARAAPERDAASAAMHAAVLARALAMVAA
jgi:carbon-monoxide dehydrogenase medium subunit